ncbi:hypothetical protein [Acinetobacter junii]|uniref:hypothetical protein n=1 Tax=Acinetobacter junii TaxID=40215 RepID=UPI0032157D86
MREMVGTEYSLFDLSDRIESIRSNFKKLLFSYSKSDYDDEVENLEFDIYDKIDSLKEKIESSENDIDIVSVFSLHSKYFGRKLSDINIFIVDSTAKIDSKEQLLEKLFRVFYALVEIEVFVDTHENSNKIRGLLDSSVVDEKKIKQNVDSSNIIINHLRHAKTFQIYNEEANKFKRYAFFYEVTFYLLIVAMFVYFSGLTIYIPDFNVGNLSFGFPSKKIASGNSIFYIQKISVLVLSSTLAAFLLKRSFMNRELFQEAYRVSQELDTLPSYIEPFSKEIQEKIRLDLAYKYFGREYNSSSNGSDKSSENTMAENIKANTEFLKALKDISISKADKSKTETEA